MPTNTKALAAAALTGLLIGGPLFAESPPRSATPDDLSWSDDRVQVAGLWGDDATGPYGKLVKFPSGLVSPAHYHSNDYTAVVISGTLLDPTDRSDTARPLAAGAFYFLPAGTAYTVRCVSAEPCLIYAHQPGAFDFNDVEPH